MTNYTINAYGPNPNAGRTRNNAAERGWGPGWPNCQTSKMVRVTNDDHTVYVRREVAELNLILFLITEKLGYDINPPGEVNQTWGFACRAIRGTQTASNHSWGLADDVNSLHNPMAYTFKSDIPPRVVNAWEICGWYWGGRYPNRPDAMHFEYIGRPQDVAADLAKAKEILANLNKPIPKPQVPPKDTSMSMWCLKRAVNGEPISHTCEFDARQMIGIAGYFYPLVIENTLPAWEYHRARGDQANAARLFRYAVKVVQANLGVTQDGFVGEETAEALRRKAGWTIT